MLLSRARWVWTDRSARITPLMLLWLIVSHVGMPVLCGQTVSQINMPHYMELFCMGHGVGTSSHDLTLDCWEERRIGEFCLLCHLIAVVKVVLWSRGAHLTKPGWSKPHTHSNPTNLALFRHKIKLYRFNQGAHTIAGGAQMGAGGLSTPPPHFNHCLIERHVHFSGGV